MQIKTTNLTILPGFAFGKLVDLFLEVNNDLLMLPLEHVCCLLWLEMNIFQEFAEFSQFSVTFPVDLELKIVYLFIAVIFLDLFKV